MLQENYSRIMEVWITGLENLEETRVYLFTFVLIIYITILTGNFLVISVVATQTHLHSPMYLFLCSLSLSEIIFTTNLIPVLLHELWKDGAAMYLTGCLAQFYVCGSLGATECFIFASMSYDRYVAICNPLHYVSVMNLQFCGELVLCSWMCGFASMLITLILVSQLDFCGPKVIDHFFCDFAPVIELSCSDTNIVKVETFIFSSSVTLFPFVFVIGSYVCIILTILKIPSSTGRSKTFSTCSSHLTVVSTYYGTLISVYVLPSKYFSSKANKILSLIYTIVTPLLNPIIYSIRNREIKKGIQKLFIQA
ncbi:olfactory receptor 11L1-like [Pseudophryne corroboree]|uniref:olfactory receptor 11L1-like n=1 Tax=Pseudophryne corroboree TaxID=495146 RepID=UPI0030817EE6